MRSLKWGGNEVSTEAQSLTFKLAQPGPPLVGFKLIPSSSRFIELRRNQADWNHEEEGDRAGGGGGSWSALIRKQRPVSCDWLPATRSMMEPNPKRNQNQWTVTREWLCHDCIISLLPSELYRTFGLNFQPKSLSTQSFLYFPSSK